MAFNCLFVAIVADPWSEDDCAHKIDVAHKLHWRGDAFHYPPIQIKRQWDGLHGHHHLGHWYKQRYENRCEKSQNVNSGSYLSICFRHLCQFWLDIISCDISTEHLNENQFRRKTVTHKMSSWWLTSHFMPGVGVHHVRFTADTVKIQK